jgi:hypothetical protein
MCQLPTFLILHKTIALEEALPLTSALKVFLYLTSPSMLGHTSAHPEPGAPEAPSCYFNKIAGE